MLIADDDPIIREVLRGMLRRQRNTKVVGEAADGDEAVDLTQKLQPDILLLDLLMPRLPGMDALRKLGLDRGAVRAIVLTGYVGKRQIVEALQLGARGILLKGSIDHLAPCIQAVVEGYYWVENRTVGTVVEIIRDLLRATKTELEPATAYGLTPRELQVLSLVTLANSNREIAQALSISEQTVKRHLVNMFDKTGMSNRLELAMFAIDRHLVSL
ncbi:MAG: response regulator transcription factor [Terriglobia bacterium]